MQQQCVGGNFGGMLPGGGEAKGRFSEGKTSRDIEARETNLQRSDAVVEEKRRDRELMRGEWSLLGSGFLLNGLEGGLELIVGGGSEIKTPGKKGILILLRGRGSIREFGLRGKGGQQTNGRTKHPGEKIN